MASTNFTTHYGIPTPLGTDLTTPMDYNQAAEAVDTALFGAVTDAGNASDAAENAVNIANAATDVANDVATDLVQEKAKIVSLQTRMTSAENEIDDVRADSSDMITAYNEPTATSTHAYAIGDFFIYNNTLYKATAAIAVGATIVPDTNCTTTNVTSELIQLNNDLAKITSIVEYRTNATDTYSDALTKLFNLVDTNLITAKSVLQFNAYVCQISDVSNLIFNNVQVSGSNYSIIQYNLHNAEARIWTTNTSGATVSNVSTELIGENRLLRIRY